MAKGVDAGGVEGTLFRYTNLASLLYVLRNRKLSLLNYLLWDDKNDQYYLSYYKRRAGHGSVLAACFTMAPERYHHWRVFAPGMDGVRIHFGRDALLPSLRMTEGVTFSAVKYRKVDEMRLEVFGLEQVPFLKRVPYSDEKEFRVLWWGAEEREYKDIDIELSAISRVTLSPWLPASLVESVRQSIKSIDGCRSIGVYRSTLRDNKRWQDYIDNLP